MALPAAMVLSGLPQEQFTGNLQIVFNHGTVLLKSPSSSSISSSASSSSCPSESGFSSLSTETERSLDYYLDVIAKLEQRFQILFECPNYVYETTDTKIMYDERNLLDLAGNLKSEWTFQHAVLQNGVNEFFENRSQLSRIGGAEIPPHKMVPCQNDDCGFQEPKYY